MRSPSFLHWTRRHLGWLLCFALLLPVAQLAGAAHAFTHLQEAGSSQRGGPDPGHVQHCPICPVAAALGAGGAPTAAAGLHLAHARAPLVAPPPHVAAPAAPRPRPANRGPPSLLA